ncbi:hypothetical protein [Chryseobacterium taichungense]|uniref:hypothetical protein n=1 Tax=Chryseobacterium taichungense TaxID=295069 RepID=UPI0028B05D83|nr:hypothetical protein [Chryseobacterium taichungense]
MEENEGQFSTINQKISTFENYIDDLILNHEANLDGNNNIIISEDAKDSFIQKKEEFLNDIIKALCISVLCGEYIEIKNFFEKLEELEIKIKELPNRTNDFQPDIQSQIFDISSAIIIVVELYKDFFREIENYYSEDRIQFLFQRNTQIKKELNKENLQQETKRKIDYFLNLLRVTSIDHFPSTEDKYIFEVFKTEEFIDNFKNPIFRDITNVIDEKIKFLRFKWKERRLQENPLMHSYLEDGIHKKIGEYTTTNLKLNEWKEIINTQYELNSNGWKALLSDRVKLYKNDEVKSFTERLKLHQLIKYYKDVNPNIKKLQEISQKLLEDKSKRLCTNFYDKYAETIFCNYSLNNEFSKYLDNETSIEKIISRYEDLNSKLIDTINNYFLKFKYLNKVFDILTPKITDISKESFIKEYDAVLDKCKVILNEYQKSIDWALINFNYIFLLPISESKARFRIDGEEYDIFYASSFVLPPTSKRIEDDYNLAKEKFDKLYSYLEFTKFFSNEIDEIQNIKNDLNSKEVKSIELLSLFTAVISFIIGGVSGFAFIKDLLTALLFFVVFTTSLLTFLIVLFAFTRGKKIIDDNKEYIIGIYVIFLIAILLLFGTNLIKSNFFNNETDIKKLEERLKNDSIKNINKSQIIQPPYPSTIYIQSKTDSVKKSTPQMQGGSN